MLNKRPIFIVGFARGGTSILLNWFRSHPGVCSPRGETQEVFRGKASEPFWVRNSKRVRYLPILLTERRDIFSIRDWESRVSFSPLTRRLVDRILHAEKVKALDPDQNLYRSENERYTREEIRRARLLCKNINGLIFLSDEFAEMYPDGTFIAIVRDGFAVCEGHIRRGMRPELIAERYEKGCERIIRDSGSIPNFHIIRYEEVVADPRGSFEKLYRWAGLDVESVKKVRLQHKPVMDKAGQHRSVVDESKPASPDQEPRYKELHWYDLDEIGRFYRTDANENQKKRLSEEAKALIEKECRNSLEYFGYL
jgi:hypothetical protein